ncbi:MAG TPA: secretion protein HlyD, partial [Leptospiraceae bacterium]|nr:secretion protein HlyD [Leptospiraceae bacterium]
MDIQFKNIPGLLADSIKKKPVWWILGTATAIVVVLALRPRPQPVETATVRRMTFEDTITEDGVTRVKEKFIILSPYSGNLVRLSRHAGDSVKKGEPVAFVFWDRETAVPSPANGSILKVFREDAGPIEIGAPIVEVGDPSSLEIVLEMLTADAVKVAPGNPIRIRGWGGADPLAAKVRIVEPQAIMKISGLGVEERRVRVLADIISPREKWKTLGDNFRLECEVIHYRQDGALVIHSGALFRDQEGWSVFRVEKGKAHKTKVQVERRGSTQSMIKSGLAEGDEVIVYPGEQIKEGV